MPHLRYPLRFLTAPNLELFSLLLHPTRKARLLEESILCNECNQAFPITVLARSATGATIDPFAHIKGEGSFTENIGNIVDLTDSAVAEIGKRLATGQFSHDTVVRVSPHESDYRKLTVLFDFALADGRDWIGESHGIPIVVDREVASELQGCTVDFRDGEFLRN